MHDATAHLFRNLAYAAHSLQKLPLRRQKEVRQALRNRGITQEILPEVAASLRDSLQGQQAGSWLHETVLQWHPDLRRYVHGRLSQFTEETAHSTGGQYTLQYSGQTLQRHSGTSGRKRRSTGRSLLATTIPAVEAAALIWGSQAPKTLTPLLNGTTWWLATVMGSKHASAIQQLLGTQDGAGKTVCACFWTRDAKKCCLSQPPLYVQGSAASHTGGNSEPQGADNNEGHPRCTCGKTFPSAMALDLHIAGAPYGSQHDWEAASRPALGLNILGFDPNHPNPFKGLVFAESQRTISYNADHEQSTSIEEQAAEAALQCMKRFGRCRPECLVSSDSLATLMVLKNMCLHTDQTARCLARTKESRVIIRCQHTCAELRKIECDITLHHEQSYHEREKRGTRDTALGLLARLNHANDLLAAKILDDSKDKVNEFCGSFRPDPMALPHFRRQGVPLNGDVFVQIGQNAYRVLMHSMLRGTGDADHLCLRLAKAGYDGLVDMTLTADIWMSLRANLQAEMLRDCIGKLPSSTPELCSTISCADGQKLRRLQRYLQLPRQQGQLEEREACPFCPDGWDTRHHWRFECKASASGMHQVHLTRSSILATTGVTFWFDPTRRIPMTAPPGGSIDLVQDQAGKGDLAEIKDGKDSRGRPKPADELTFLESKRNHHSWFSADRLAVLQTMWNGQQGDNFADNAYSVVRECIQRSKDDLTETTFSRIGQLPRDLVHALNRGYGS